MENSLIFYYLIVIGVSLLLLYIFRGVMLWYWGVRETLNNQKEQTEILKQLLAHMKGEDYSSFDPEFDLPQEESVNDPNVLKKAIKGS